MRRRRPILASLWTLLFGLIVLPQIAGAADSIWRTDFAAAQAEAEREQKPLLLHFYAVWCGPCSKMDRDVFKSAEVKQLLSDRVIGVKIDSDRHPNLLHQYGIQMLPSDIIIDPANGRVLISQQGALDLKGYLSMASRGEGKFLQAQAALQQAKRENDTAAIDKKPGLTGDKIPTESQTGPLKIDLGDPQPLVGLDGYSPVALTKHRKWVRGSAKFTWDYQGITYQLTTREELLAFRNDPEAYAPRLLGCDPVLLWETDRAVPGRTLYGAFFDDELYFFTSNENRKRFKANPQRFMKTQHVLKVDQIDRTALLDESHLK